MLLELHSRDRFKQNALFLSLLPSSLHRLLHISIILRACEIEILKFIYRSLVSLFPPQENWRRALWKQQFGNDEKNHGRKIVREITGEQEHIFFDIFNICTVHLYSVPEMEIKKREYLESESATSVQFLDSSSNVWNNFDVDAPLFLHQPVVTVTRNLRLNYARSIDSRCSFEQLVNDVWHAINSANTWTRSNASTFSSFCVSSSLREIPLSLLSAFFFSFFVERDVQPLARWQLTADRNEWPNRVQ